METVRLELPYPPSVNHYYRHFRGRVVISAKGRAYRESVRTQLKCEDVQMFPGNIELIIDAYPPDNRRRDADNLEKCLFDSLVAGGLIVDDCKIKRHTMTMREPMPECKGMIYIEAKEYNK